MIAAESAGRRPDVPALTGLRFLAAFSVLLAHGLGAIMASNAPPQGAVLWLMQSSGFGMTLFFVLSGFVIHYNYAGLVTDGRLRGIAAFFWARFARLYPLFLLMMLVYVLVSQRHVAYWTGRPEDINAIFQALPYFLLSIQSWIYKLIGGGALIDAIRGGSPPTWSISPPASCSTKPTRSSPPTRCTRSSSPASPASRSSSPSATTWAISSPIPSAATPCASPKRR